MYISSNGWVVLLPGSLDGAVLVDFAMMHASQVKSAGIDGSKWPSSYSLWYILLEWPKDLCQ